jgi:type IV pilus assembly protein PilV
MMITPDSFPNVRKQRGVFLLEALIALLIFAFGILGIVALGATAIAAQNDAQYRTEAANFANEIVGRMWSTYNPGDHSAAPLAAAAAVLSTYAHNPTGDPATCDFSGSASTNAEVVGWVDRVTTIDATNKGLPGATGAGGALNRQQIVVNPAASNQVTVTICWQTPKDSFPRRHTYVAYIN